MITLRFVTGRDPVSAVIRAFEYGFWASHVEAQMPDGSLLGAHANGGVLARPRGYDALEVVREMFVSIPATDAQADKFYAFLRGQLGKPYDTKAIAGIVAQRDWRDDGAWMCSELMAAALCECGIFPAHLATEFNHVTPRDLLLIVSGRMELVA
jgi:hypothetical protein